MVAVEIHQQAAGSSDVSFDFSLTGQPPPPPPPQPLYWGKVAADWVLAWGDPTYQLWQSTNVLGPWSLAPGSSPLLFNPTNPHAFFQLRK